MRKLSFVAVATLLLSFSSTYANDFNKDEKKVNDPAKEIRSEIVEYLGELEAESVEEAMVGNVQLFINKDHEIVVLSIDTKSEFLESFVKGKLNYKKVKAAGVPQGRVYTLPVRIQ